MYICEYKYVSIWVLCVVVFIFILFQFHHVPICSTPGQQAHCFWQVRSQHKKLLQRGCAMHNVTEYFADSLKVTQGHSKYHPWLGHCKAMFVLCCNSLYLVLFLRYSSSNSGATLKSGLKVTRGHWNYVSLFGMSHMSSCWRSIVTMALSRIIC